MSALDDAPAAERAVVGAVIFDPACLRFAAEVVTPDDFADTRVGHLYGLVAGMVSAGVPVNLVTVHDAIQQRQAELVKYPQWSEVVTWVEGASSATVAHYADIVRRESLRRLTDRILVRAHQALATGEAPSVALSAAITDLREVQAGSGGFDASHRLLADVLAEDDVYEWVIPGLLERKDRVMLTGGEGAGKALAVDTEVPTPHGWRLMGSLCPGDQVFGADGRMTRVVATTPWMTNRECYRVEFSDGSSIVADVDHLWLTDDYASRRSATRSRGDKPLQTRGTDQSGKRAVPSVRTTAEIRDTLMARDGFCVNHSIPAHEGLQLPPAALPIPPYVLGAWLGDGHSAGGRITIGDEDRDDMLRILTDLGWPPNKQSGRYLYGIRGLLVRLRALGVLNNKHIPHDYMWASRPQRLALLQGLMDTDGTVSRHGSGSGRGSGAATCEFSVVSERLARDVHELALSLGIIASFTESPAKLNGRIVGTRYRIRFQTDLPVFGLPRKAQRLTRLRTQRSRRRFIRNVVPVESVPVRCIQVEAPDGLFLAGRAMVTTHNSTLVRQMALCAAAGLHPFTLRTITPLNVLVVDAENSERQWRRNARPINSQAKLRGQRDPSGHLELACRKRMDITKDRDLGALHQLMDETQPDILFIGPLYRLVPFAITNDDHAAPVLAALDSLRDRGPALVMEAHAGHGQTKGGDRDLRPRGSSALLGWPEFGFGLTLTGKVNEQNKPAEARLVRWRGDREERDWPDVLERGGLFPWTQVNSSTRWGAA